MKKIFLLLTIFIFSSPVIAREKPCNCKMTVENFAEVAYMEFYAGEVPGLAYEDKCQNQCRERFKTKFNTTIKQKCLEIIGKEQKILKKLSKFNNGKNFGLYSRAGNDGSRMVEICGKLKSPPVEQIYSCDHEPIEWNAWVDFNSFCCTVNTNKSEIEKKKYHYIKSKFDCSGYFIWQNKYFKNIGNALIKQGPPYVTLE